MSIWGATGDYRTAYSNGFSACQNNLSVHFSIDKDATIGRAIKLSTLRQSCVWVHELSIHATTANVGFEYFENLK